MVDGLLNVSDEYLHTQRDFPVRENPDFVDFALHHARMYRIKQLNFLNTARTMVIPK